MNPILNEQAQEIAAATGQLLGRSVLITDMNGMITGCTSPERVGTFHAPSLPVIAFGKETYDDEEAAAKLGVLPGVTLPFAFFGKIVGSVAVAGKPEEVLPFALLIKKQAEMMLREKLYLQNRYTEDRSLKKLIARIAAFDPMEDVFSELLAQGEEAGFDLSLPRITVAFEIKRFRPHASFASREHSESEVRYDLSDPLRSELDAQVITKDILSNVRSIFDAPQDICCDLRRDQFVVMAVVRKKISIVTMCEKVLAKALENSVELVAGIGSPAFESIDLASTYGEAWKALSLGGRIAPGGHIFNIMELQLENMIALSGRKALSKRMVKRLEAVLAQSGGAELLESYRCWFENYFNLKEAAALLNIHRNTLYYRIDKLSREVGMDLRNFKQSLALYLAVVSLRLRS